MQAILCNMFFNNSEVVYQSSNHFLIVVLFDYEKLKKCESYISSSKKIWTEVAYVHNSADH